MRWGLLATLCAAVSACGPGGPGAQSGDGTKTSGAEETTMTEGDSIGTSGGSGTGGPEGCVGVPELDFADQYVDYDDYPSATAVDPAGNLVLAIAKESVADQYSSLVAKFTPDGTLAWLEPVAAPFPGDLEVDPSGNITVGGAWLDGAAPVTRLDPDGTVQWEVELESTLPNITLSGLGVAQDGTVWVGLTETDDGNIGNDSSRVTRLTDDGTIELGVDLAAAWIWDVEARPGGALVAGENDIQDGWLASIRDDGSVAWARDEPSLVGWRPRELAVDTDGGFGVVAYDSNRLAIRRFDAEANLLWAYEHEVAGPDSDIAFAADGDVLVASTVPGPAVDDYDVSIARYDRDGACSWEDRFGSDEHPSRDQGKGVAVDAAGGVFAVGGLNTSPLGENNIWSIGYRRYRP